MIAVRFTEDRGPRRAGDVVRFDDRSAARVVADGVAEYVDDVAEVRQFGQDEPIRVVRVDRDVEPAEPDADTAETASADPGD